MPQVMFGALPWWSLNVEDVQRLYFGNFSRTTAKTGVTNNRSCRNGKMVVGNRIETR